MQFVVSLLISLIPEGRGILHREKSVTVNMKSLVHLCDSTVSLLQ